MTIEQAEGMPLSQDETALVADILDLSRQNNIGTLSPWFTSQLHHYVAIGEFVNTTKIAAIRDAIVTRLASYRTESKTGTVVLGMSGGVDSAVVAALFKAAGYRVIGATMPIHQNPEETERGVEACQALGLEHIHADLSEDYDAALTSFSAIIAASSIALTGDTSEHGNKIRRGNIRARTRMKFLYHLAHEVGGFVASTDNFSELVAGFWTLHGDVGDVAPIQSLFKSWEVVALARLLGVPEKTWRATPTDGLGITAGDEVQLGASYLQWDIITLAISDAVISEGNDTIDQVRQTLETEFGETMSDDDLLVFEAVIRRIGGSWFKRKNPLNFDHPFSGSRLSLIDEIDDALFVPDSAKEY